MSGYIDNSGAANMHMMFTNPLVRRIGRISQYVDMQNSMNTYMNFEKPKQADFSSYIPKEYSSVSDTLTKDNDKYWQDHPNERYSYLKNLAKSGDATADELKEFSALKDAKMEKIAGNISSGVNIASTAMDMLGTSLDLAKGRADTSGFTAQADALASTKFAGTNESLIAQRDATADMTKKSYSDIGGISDGEIAMNTAGSTLKGVATGLAVGGPIGAIVGGVAGLGSGIIGGIFGHKKDKQKQRELNSKIQKSNAIAQRNYVDAAKGNDKDQFRSSMLNSYALGGDLESNDTTFNPYLTIFNTGGSHEENPYGGIPQGIAEDGQPNLVEEGEVKWNDYIFSKRLTIPENDLELYKIAKRYKGKSYADIAKDLYKEKADRPVDSISDKTMAANLLKLQMSQEMLKAQQEEAEAGESMAYALGGLLSPDLERDEVFDEMIRQAETHGKKPAYNEKTGRWYPYYSDAKNQQFSYNGAFDKWDKTSYYNFGHGIDIRDEGDIVIKKAANKDEKDIKISDLANHSDGVYLTNDEYNLVQDAIYKDIDHQRSVRPGLGSEYWNKLPNNLQNLIYSVAYQNKGILYSDALQKAVMENDENDIINSLKIWTKKLGYPSRFRRSLEVYNKNKSKSAPEINPNIFIPNNSISVADKTKVATYPLTTHSFAKGGKKDKVYYPMRIANGDGTYTMLNEGYSPTESTPGYYLMDQGDGSIIYGVPENENEWKQAIDAYYFTHQSDPELLKTLIQNAGNSRNIGTYQGASPWMNEFNKAFGTMLNIGMAPAVLGTTLPLLGETVGNVGIPNSWSNLFNAAKAVSKTQKGQNFLWASGAIPAAYEFGNLENPTASDYALMALSAAPGGSMVGQGVKQSLNSSKNLLRHLGFSRQQSRNILLNKNIFNNTKDAENFVQETGNAAHILGIGNDGKVGIVKLFNKDGKLVKETVNDIKSWGSQAAEIGQKARQNIRRSGDINERINLLSKEQLEKLPESVKKSITALKEGNTLTDAETDVLRGALNDVTRKQRYDLNFGDVGYKTANFFKSIKPKKEWFVGTDLGKSTGQKYNVFYNPTKGRYEQVWNIPGGTAYIEASPYGKIEEAARNSRINFYPGLDEYAKSQSTLVKDLKYWIGSEPNKAAHTYLYNPNFWGTPVGRIINDKRLYESILGAGATLGTIKGIYSATTDTGGTEGAQTLPSLNEEINKEAEINSQNAVDSINNVIRKENFTGLGDGDDEALRIYDSVNNQHAYGGFLKMPHFKDGISDNTQYLNGLKPRTYTEADLRMVNPLDYKDPWAFTTVGNTAGNYSLLGNVSPQQIKDIENSDIYKQHWNNIVSNDNYLKKFLEGYLGGLPKEGYDDLRKNLTLKDDLSNKQAVVNYLKDHVSLDGKAGLGHNILQGDRYYTLDTNGNKVYVEKPNDGPYQISPNGEVNGPWTDYQIMLNPKSPKSIIDPFGIGITPTIGLRMPFTSSSKPSAVKKSNVQPVEGQTNPTTQTKKKSMEEVLRYAPILGDSLQYLSTALKSPDYSDVELMKPQKIGVGWHPIGNYQKFKPVDVNYYLSKLDQQRLGTQSLLRNSVNGNQAAYQALALQNDANYRDATAKAMKEAEDINYNRYNSVTKFNRETDAANQNADITVQGQRIQAEKEFMDAMYKYALARKGVKDQYDTTKAYFGQKFFDDLGSLGKEAYQRNNADLELWRAIAPYFLGQQGTAKKVCGGYLTIKTRR